jgi:hypothetical protein
MRPITMFAAVAAVGLAASGAAQQPVVEHFDRTIRQHGEDLWERGRQIFRYDNFGDEAFWGGALKLHQAIAGERFGGVGPGVSPATALSVGLKVDIDALPAHVVQAIRHGRVDLNDPGVTLQLLDADAVVGVKGFRGPDGRLSSVGIQCALCHSDVDDSFAPGVGHRLDGWPNRDLNVGEIVALSPDLSAVADLLGTDQATVRTVLNSWGPGKFDAQLFLDGKAFRPDGRSAATLIPAAFGLAGVNLTTYTGWGGVSHWNAFVANLEMHGKGTFVDARLNDPLQFPVAARAGFGNVRNDPDLITSKLPALQFDQLSIPAPRPSHGSFDPALAEQGRGVFNGAAGCASCHVPPIFTEPGWNMHTAEEIGIDDFQASRSPDRRYRTTPLRTSLRAIRPDGQAVALPAVERIPDERATVLGLHRDLEPHRVGQARQVRDQRPRRADRLECQMPMTRRALCAWMLLAPLTAAVPVAARARGAARTFRARLSVVPIDLTMAKAVAGRGSVTATLDGRTLVVSGTFEGLRSPATLARVHRGPNRGLRGPVIFDLMVTTAAKGELSGTLELSAAQVTDLERGRLYVQLHSESAPEGNLWGWLLPK